ncbi:MAG: WecB/TagA/CpsF family glycosyltransferase [Planctomycetales bacterium]|nr:WecB/TagA/CpsF family glycosyltransferase [Planctomycetales bacterium]
MNKRIRFFGVDMDVLRMDEAVRQVLAWTESPTDHCRFVVTPNVDHTVMLQSRDDLKAVYDVAHLVLADGFPLIMTSKLLGRGLPERVAGSELVPRLFELTQQENRTLTVYLLGAADGVADRAAQRIHAQWPNVKVIGTYSPPMGFEKDDAENQAILDRINSVRPQLLVVGLGAPKQELWVHRFYQQIEADVALCVGATIDFLAGEKPQAPVWMRRTGLEWIHRVCSEPKRLAKRYAKDAIVFPQLVWKEWRSGGKTS